jgi:hypothetical protein
LPTELGDELEIGSTRLSGIRIGSNIVERKKPGWARLGWSGSYLWHHCCNNGHELQYHENQQILDRFCWFIEK